MKQAAVAVPVYKNNLSDTEYISYKQLFKILGQYDIYFVCPEKLNADYLTNHKTKRFPKQYFDGIPGYNRLMLSIDFYREFFDYQFVLIYQLDALVFSDSLDFFCSLNYDYIGAPLLSPSYINIDNREKEIYIENGGLSLRNVRSCVNLLQNYKDLNAFPSNEDVFFSSSDSNSFRVATREDALKFSFAMEVRRCYQLNHYKLPFGCHAWFKYDLDFWRSKLIEFGHDLSNLKEDGKMDKVIEKGRKFMNADSVINDTYLTGREVYIWGCGKYGIQALNLLEKNEIRIGGFIDNDMNKIGKEICGHKIYSPDTVWQMAFPNIVVVAIAFQIGGKGVGEQLKENGKIYLKDYIFYYDLVG